RRWHDFQAKQQRATQTHEVPNTPFASSGDIHNRPTQRIVDPAVFAQEPGARDFVLPAIPLPKGPRFNEAPVNSEYDSRFAPQGATPR
ncbi:MAG TPA: hypothetical protein VK137_10490, partial [Planctomycetaceae bacterium]|nr:hypothetical protein [Planctomycetaceae bacterium]